MRLEQNASHAMPNDPIPDRSISLAEVVRRIDELRRELQSEPLPERAAYLRERLTRLTQISGTRLADFDFGQGPECGMPLTAQPGTTIPEDNRASPVGGHAELSPGLKSAWSRKTYRQPSQREQYLMRVLGFDSLQKMEEWMNRPADPAFRDKPSDPYLDDPLEEEIEWDDTQIKEQNSNHDLERAEARDPEPGTGANSSIIPCSESSTPWVQARLRPTRIEIIRETWTDTKGRISAAMKPLAVVVVAFAILWIFAEGLERGMESIFESRIGLYLLRVALFASLSCVGLWTLRRLAKIDWKMIADSETRGRSDAIDFLVASFIYFIVVLITLCAVGALFYWGRHL